jgi:predicted ATP-grasp superfamily ATP-dependent carboligase
LAVRKADTGLARRSAAGGTSLQDSGGSPDHAGYDILILDAEHKQSLAAARSLGRAGLRVALGESLDQYRSHPPLPAFCSRYCARGVVLPSYADDPDAYAAAVIEFVRTYPTPVILPAGDATCVSLMPYRQQLAELGSVLALPADHALAIALDKDHTLRVAGAIGIACPRSVRIDSVEELSFAIDEFGFPFVIKPTVSWTAIRRDRVLPVEVIDKAEAVEVAERFLAGGAVVLAQQWVPGRREGVTLFIAGGEVVASCGHDEHRTTPALGGVSVMRQSVQTPPDVYDAAVRLALAIGLEGICEVEFRRDADGDPLLMEVNPRLPGTLDTSIRSGVDFPLLSWQLATGRPVNRVPGYRPGVRTRWLHGDLRWLRDNYNRASRPDSMSRGRAIWTFISEFARTRHYDHFDMHDLAPAIAEMRYTVAVILKSVRK